MKPAYCKRIRRFAQITKSNEKQLHDQIWRGHPIHTSSRLNLANRFAENKEQGGEIPALPGLSKRLARYEIIIGVETSFFSVHR
jgi:hypothetical protein